MAKSDMKELPFFLSDQDRDLVESVIARHCDIRSWRLHAVNARTNHVHVVVTAPGYHPKIVRDQFKSWCSRLLKPNYPSRQRFWTEAGSCRWIALDQDLETAVIYTRETQDRKNRD